MPVTEEWLHQTVDVDLTSVLDFAMRMQTSVEEFTTSVTDGVKPLMMGVHPRFGGHILSEGAFFGAYHGKQVEAAMRLLNDALVGLATLAKGSAAVAAEYMFGDATSEATVDDVYDAFTPTPKPAESTEAATTGTVVEEDPVLPAEAYQTDTSGTPSGSGYYVAEGKPGEFWISTDNEGMDECTPDAPKPRA